MNRTRLFALAVGILAIGAGLVGWFLGVSPILDQAANAESQLEAARAENATQQAILAQLKLDYEELPAKQAELDGLQLTIPDNANTAGLTSTLGALAAANGVVVSSATFGEPTIYTAGGTADAVEGALVERLYTVTMTASVSGPPPGLIAFLNALQVDTRILAIDVVQLSSGEAPTLDVSGLAFVIAPKGTTPVAPPAAEIPAEEETAEP